MLVEEEARARRKSTDARARVIYRKRKRVWRNRGASVLALAGKKLPDPPRPEGQRRRGEESRLVGADADYFHRCTCPSRAFARAPNACRPSGLVCRASAILRTR